MTHKKDFLKLYGLPENTSLSIEDISALTGIPTEALQIVYNRGIGAWKSSAVGIRRTSDGKKDYSTSRAGKMGKERWAAARVYSFVMMGKTWETADHDVAEYYGFVKK